MIFKYLLTLLLLFIAPHETALAPVLSDDDTLECSDDYYWEGEHSYYTWESCLFDYSGTYDDEVRLDRDDHQALFDRVWTDYMGDLEPPRLRRGRTAVEDVCEPLDDDGQEWPTGCFAYDWETCGLWQACIVYDTIAVRSTDERLLLHETAHAIYVVTYWHHQWGLSSWGSHIGTNGHTMPFRCLLLDIYNHYTDDVAADAYEMLDAVCAADGY